MRWPSACQKSIFAEKAYHSGETTWESVHKSIFFFLKNKKNRLFEKRIATPVCALARNDKVFDSLRATAEAVALLLMNCFWRK